MSAYCDGSGGCGRGGVGAGSGAGAGFSTGCGTGLSLPVMTLGAGLLGWRTGLGAGLGLDAGGGGAEAGGGAISGCGFCSGLERLTTSSFWPPACSDSSPWSRVGITKPKNRIKCRSSEKINAYSVRRLMRNSMYCSRLAGICQGISGDVGCGAALPVWCAINAVIWRNRRGAATVNAVLG